MSVLREIILIVYFKSNKENIIKLYCKKVGLLKLKICYVERTVTTAF
jgi:hypothetical protein